MIREWRYAARQPGVWLGFVAIAMLSVAACCGAATLANFSALGPFKLARRVVPQAYADMLWLPGLALICVAFLLLRPAAHARRLPYRAVFLLWCLPLLPAPALLSNDAYLYLDQAWQLQAGYAPYQVGLSGAGGPYAYAVDPVWRGTPALYPPFAIEFQRIAVILGGARVVTSLWAFRVIVIGFCLLLSWAIPLLARRVNMDPVRAVYLCLLNPLLVVHLVGGTHNDALMITFAALALVVAARGRAWWVLGAVLAGVAALSKQPGLWIAVPVAMLAVPAARWPKRIAVLSASVAIAAATFVAGSLATGLGFGWIAGASVPSRIGTLSPPYVVTELIEAMTGLHLWEAGMKLSYLPALVIMAWLILRRWRFPFTVAAAGLLAYVAFSPAMHPWYLLEALPFAGLLRLRPATRVLLELFACYALFGGWISATGYVQQYTAAAFGLSVGIAATWGWREIRSRVKTSPMRRIRRRPA